MLFRSLASASMRLRSTHRPARNMSSIPTFLYENVWRKSNVFYVTYIFGGCVVVEAIYGTLTNFLWESANQNVMLAICIYSVVYVYNCVFRTGVCM